MFEEQERAERRLVLQRIQVYLAIVLLAFAVLALRIYYLQVVKGDYFRRLSEENRISTVRVKAPRGIIYDRFGNVLVTNRPSYSVNVVPENVREMEGTLDMLAGALDMERAEVERKIKEVRRHRRFEPVRIKDDVDRRTVALLETIRYEWPGLHIEVEPRRSYPHGNLASHILGYVSEISPEELRRRKGRGYRIGDHIGKRGIEKKLDDELKGGDGSLRVEVDSLGREVEVLEVKEPVPGDDVVLTIDLGLQQVADESLRGKAGAVVVLDVRQGEILAVSSSPAVDPNLFSRGLSLAEWKDVERDERHPLQNRAFQAQYPPGSVFKIVTAAAALDKEAISAETAFYCNGSLPFGGRNYGCWKRGGHGEVSLHRALVESCDVFFYQTGIRTGIDAIAIYAREFGLGSPTGIALGQEVSGLVPDSEWKLRSRGEIWYPGETLSAAIGQGYNLVSPLQLAVLASVVAGEGVLRSPQLVQTVRSAEGKSVRPVPAGEGKRVQISTRALKLVSRALKEVVEGRRGTGRAARVPGLTVAGKTGTAQVVRLAQGSEEKTGEEVPYRFRDHAWFVCFAPAEEAKVAVAVLVEHGGHGGSAAAPIAARILREMKNLGFFAVVAGR